MKIQKTLCDFCGKEFGENEFIHQVGVGLLGCSADNETEHEYDACDECAKEMDKIIRAETVKVELKIHE